MNARIAEADVQLEGYTVPRGSRLLVNSFAICRDDRFFPDADQFMPDRWVEANLKNYDSTRNFGGGLR